MAFDQSTRNRLQKFVSDARDLLSEEFTRQLQNDYGLDPNTGAISPLENLTHLDDTHRETARILRDTLAHYLASGPSGGARGALERIVREQAFTVLNRLAALRMAESRGILIESVGNGYQSKGFQLYERLAGSGLGETGDTYRCYLFSIFDEFALDLKVLFDRFSPQGRLFPRETALLELLKLLNDPELAHLWAEDETIGWIYQYFNSKEERKKMRDESAAPRNSRELAVRNQFFTPRYVVEFLTDNTLGRIWYEMTQGETGLKDFCRYLVRRPAEIFLKPGEAALVQAAGDENLSQEELLKQIVHIPHRPLKDPRTIRMLDPACGSMHFGLYSFDLFERIYEEAWELELRLGGAAFVRKAGLRPLTETYPDKDAFLRDVPRLIIEHNIHGIDIDPRAVQIAGLSLWLRAQRSWHNQGVKSADRPRITRSNIVCAEPMPGEDDMRREFTAGLKPRVLGQIVDEVFQKMKLAGEAGSLLKIEEDIKDAVAAAKKQWEEQPKPVQLALFGESAPVKPVQMELRFDVIGVADKRFWDQAEDRILDALKDYAEQAENGRAVRRRLFAEDAARGFAFIDLCRKRYEVVLMNPPFGEFSKQYKSFARIVYPNSYNDILGAFVERWLLCLEDHGRLGAITSRTCFYLVSFTDWREKVILTEAALAAVADLGQGVMDDAMVEAAAYILERSRPTAVIPFIRSIAERDRQAIVGCCVSAINTAASEPHLFLARQDTFRKLPGAPFVYWTNSDDLDRFAALPTFEPEAAEVRVGLQTGDDPRFVRAVWEVAEKDTQFVYYPANGETYCRLDDPIVLAYRQRRKAGTPRWAFHVKSGASQPWYSPITLKIDWHQDGSQLRNFRDAQGKLRSRPQNITYYYRPGFSWTRRAVRFYPYVIPSNCIPSVSRYMAFPDHGMQAKALGVCASRLVSAFLRFYGEKFEFPNFLVDTLKALPWPELPDEAKAHFEELISREVEQRRLAYQNHEPFHEFLLSGKIRDFSNSGQSLSFDAKSLLDADTENMVADAFGFTEEQARAVERDLLEAISYQKVGGASDEGNDEENAESEEETDSDFVLDYSKAALEEANMSYLVGIAFGRWDVRMAIDESLAPKLSAPFDPLPVCPPGMLVGPDGLPAEQNNIVSEEWLRARPDANTLPPLGTVKNPIIPDSEYPIYINWSGILVEDEGHPKDIGSRIREVIEVIWKEKAGDIEHEACEILGVRSLRDYFSKPSCFFADHLKRYSKSRRQAPIYWPLSTPSGSYTLWIYYHRLNDQTIYTCVMDYVEPKLRDIAGELSKLRQNGIGRNRDDEKKLERLQDFDQELRAFCDELLRVARLPWKPNLNDGVQITAAPLWKLFQLPKWKKTLKGTWEKLEKGDYDWAHLAYSIWPDRVREKCRKDKSLAIAHNLEELYEEPPASGKIQRGRCV